MSNAELKYTCDKAVDGNLSQDLKDGSCILSKSKTKNFWEVTLDKIYAISSIKIYNRLDSGGKDFVFYFPFFPKMILCFVEKCKDVFQVLGFGMHASNCLGVAPKIE